MIALAGAFGVLLISRSVLSPPIVSQYAPFIALGLIIILGSPYLLQLRVNKFMVPLVVSCAAFFLSTLGSGGFALALRAACMALLWCAVFLVASNFRESEWIYFARFLLVLCVLEGCLAYFETIFEATFIRDSVAAAIDRGYPLRPNTILGDWTNRAQGTMGYPIPFSNFICVGIALLMSARIVPKFHLRVILGVVLLGAVLLSGTRTGLVALAVSITLTRIVQLRREGGLTKIAFLLLFSPCIAALLWEFTGAREFSTDGSFIHRLGVLESVQAVFGLGIRQTLVGSGYDSHVALFASGLLDSYGTYAVDNAFITFLITSGLIGLLGIGLLIVVALRRFDSTLFPIVLIFVVFGMSYDFQNWHASMFLFCLIVGYAVSPYKGKAESFAKVSIRSK